MDCSITLSALSALYTVFVLKKKTFGPHEVNFHNREQEGLIIFIITTSCPKRGY